MHNHYRTTYYDLLRHRITTLLSHLNGNIDIRFAKNFSQFNTINDFPEIGSAFGVNIRDLVLYEGFVIPSYSRCIFINYGTSRDAAIIAISSGGTVYTAFRNNDVWINGDTCVKGSKFELVGCVVNGISGSVVEIPGSPPSSDYIPVITGHQNTLVANDNVYWQDNQKKWFFYTNVSQTVWLRFYKYPV